MRRPSRRSIAAGGYTLLEMIIVLVLLVVLVGLAWPAMQKPFRKGQIRGAAKQVRDQLLRARLEAINSGTTLVFRFQPGLGVFEVAPYGAVNGELDPEFAVSSGGLDPLMSGAAMVDTALVTDPLADSLAGGAGDPLTASPRIGTGPQFLDHEIRFWAQDMDDGSASGGSTDAALGIAPSLSGGIDPAPAFGPLAASDDFSAAASWSPPILFYPNGRTSNARIRLSDEGEYYVDVNLRGLTGSARISKVRRWEDLWKEGTVGGEGSFDEGLLEEVPLETIAPQAGPALEMIQ